MAHARRYDWPSVVDRYAEAYRIALGEAVGRTRSLAS
jgi:hypothetical protein